MATPPQEIQTQADRSIRYSYNGPTELSELYKLATHTYREGGGTRPEVRLVNVDGIQYVLKDYNRCDDWFSKVFGKMLALREGYALEELCGMIGVPGLAARLGDRALLIEFVPGAERARKKPECWTIEYFDQLQKLLEDMHGQGYAHGDLRRSSNILVDDQLRPWLVDFASSFAAPKSPSGLRSKLRRWAFRQMRRADHNAVYKLKTRVAPHLLTERESLLAEHNLVDRVVRGFGRVFRALNRFLFTSRNKRNHGQNR